MPRKRSTSGEKTLHTAKELPADPPVNPGVNRAVSEGPPSAEQAPFPVVAVGASAGGLEAFQKLLEALPVDTGMAYVLIQHLMPTHESMLTAILGRATKMAVHEVTNNMVVRPDTIYVIPPGKSMVLGHGALQLAPRTEVHGVARPIDHFMRSLAEEHGHRAIGVVLSGTGTDGTLGLQEIKAGGGITLAQDSTADQSGMPSSAIAAGAVDVVLPPDEIAKELVRIAVRSRDDDPMAMATASGDLDRVIDALGDGTDVNFGQYKKNTLYRRVVRRMLIRKVDSMADYADLLLRDEVEVGKLYQDVLINVTSFFRNPESYEALKSEVFPKLVAAHGRTKEIRVWALGCSTGEEAYSLAMTFTEYLEESGKRATLQLFATDLNAAGIERARSGIYPKGIVQDVSPERLKRFFVEVDGSYRIAKPIRDMCVFARQNVLADPPFSRIDLIACRNMLIYIDTVQQQRLISLLHFALRNDGYLWLGGSETIGAQRHLFDLVDARNKIYSKKKDGKVEVELPRGHRWLGAGTTRAALPTAAERAAADPFAEADRQIMTRYAPAGVIVNAELDIVQFRGDASAYLAPSPGRPSTSLLKMLRRGLLVPVRGALHRARDTGQPVRLEDLRVKLTEGWREVDIVVMPLAGASRGSFAVLFEERSQTREARARKLTDEADARMDEVEFERSPAVDEDREFARLSQELAATREYLQAVIEQQEAANEELQAANEEAQSANEEMQSINEELETSKEEIQSSNEELVTLNEELNDRNAQLALVNNDLVNLVGSVQMSIVFVGRDLRIRRYSPMAELNMNLVSTDVGRSIADVRTHLSIDDLDKQLLEVIESMQPRESEVMDRAGHWYLLRMRPYRTLENTIDGAVLMLFDIGEIKKSQHALLESEQRFELLANSAPVMIWVGDFEGYRFVNRAFEQFVGAIEADVQVASPTRYVHPDDRAQYMAAYRYALERREAMETRVRMRRADGTYRWMNAMGTPSFLPNGNLLGLVGCTFDITELQNAEAVLKDLDRGKDQFMAMLAHELRNPLAGVRNACRLLAESTDAAEIEAARAIIDRQSAHMARMVDELLDVARIARGKLKVERETIDLAQVARMAIAATDALREERHHLLAVTLPEGPMWVQGDAMRLEQVVTNLLANASKFTRQGGHVWISLEREAAPDGEGVRGLATLRVRDDGVGIDRAQMGQLFALYAQSDHASARSRTGIGVGLALAKQLVEMHQGSIEAFSAGASLGSEFVVRIPMASAPASGPSPRDSAGRARSIARRVLIVDDDRDGAESMRILLKGEGHEVRVVSEGLKAVSATAEFKPEVILLDIGLPDADGNEIAAALRRHPAGKDVHLIAVTGFGQADDFRRSREAGADAHLVKPIDVDALYACIAMGRPGS